MYSLFTTKGSYAVKLLNPYVMQRENVMDNYRTAEGIERMLEENGIPILPALIVNGRRMHRIDGRSQEEIRTGISEVKNTVAQMVYYHNEKDNILNCLRSVQ